MSQFVASRARSAIFSLKPYVPGKPIEEVKRELGLEDIVKLASNENPLGPSPLAQRAAASILDQLHYYPDSNCFELKQKLSERYNLSPSSILIGNGSDELLKLAALAFLNPGEQVVLPQPSFSAYEFSAKVMDGVCLPVPLADFTHDLSAMLQAVTEQTKIIYICNPNNPTGTIVSREQIDEFMSQVPDHVLVVFDEAYSEYAESPDYVSGLEYLRAGKNVMVCRTFSKIYGLAGLRIGYAFTTPEIAGAIERVTDPFNVNSVAQIAALAALDDFEHLWTSQELNQKGKHYLYEQLNNLGLYYVPTQANFIFIDTRQDCRKVFQGLLQQGVIVRPGDVFGYPTFIRVTIGTAAENARFINSLRTVLENLS
ncbi:MAG TPA: histidinol-phosphate transaminase [Syntrophomonadaceae bacterium]|nr:histidinol-phosphate transaminase [Syntrophomonadaceae bacterium]HOQ08823.1 histidinol-phosphate transaminase [Syntrophomonadaceae bacterium]HPU47634.1 histidinol-phosphate transaminase [Syntrophomonadaceae bacterium]